MHSPPSYQEPPAEASLNTTFSQTPPHNSGSISETYDPANPESIISSFEQKPTLAVPKIKTKHILYPTKSSDTSGKMATQFTDSLTLLRNNQKTRALESITKQKETFLSALSDLASTHETRMGELTSVNADLAEFDLTSTALEFKDATGQNKRSATLAERMKFFETRIDQIRSLIEGTISERERVEAEIGTIGNDLRAMLDNEEEQAMEEKADEYRRRIEKVVDDAVKAWDLQEKKYVKEKALHREELLKLCGEGELKE